MLAEAVKIGTVKWVYFEGGEPFLFYPVMVEGLRVARDMGFKTGVVTNSYWATSAEDAELWLKPLFKLVVADLSVSDDSFHFEDEKEKPTKHALAAAEKLGIPVGVICIDRSTVEVSGDSERAKGEPVVGGDVMFKGRAVEKLTGELPTRHWQEFTECPYEDLKNPKRVHLDSYGNVHLCQGLIMGNMWRTSLSELFKCYNFKSHPICKALVEGGPSLLAREQNIKPHDRYVDACHFCYDIRLSLLDRFPDYLAPKQIYGLEEEQHN